VRSPTPHSYICLTPLDTHAYQRPPRSLLLQSRSLLLQSRSLLLQSRALLRQSRSLLRQSRASFAAMVVSFPGGFCHYGSLFHSKLSVFWLSLLMRLRSLLVLALPQIGGFTPNRRLLRLACMECMEYDACKSAPGSTYSNCGASR